MPIVPIPRLGEDNKEVYGMWLGMAADEIGKLWDQRVISPQGYARVVPTCGAPLRH